MASAKISEAIFSSLSLNSSWDLRPDVKGIENWKLKIEDLRLTPLRTSPQGFRIEGLGFRVKTHRNLDERFGECGWGSKSLNPKRLNPFSTGH
jgi:hypothetical protein